MMQRFSEDEAQEILRRAARAPSVGEYTSEELRRSAAELGISDEALARAEAEVREERVRREFDLYMRSKMRDEIVQTAITIGGLAILNLLTSPHTLWFLWVAPWMLLSMVGTIQKVRDRHSPRYRRAFERWQAKAGRRGEGELSEMA